MWSAGHPLARFTSGKVLKRVWTSRPGFRNYVGRSSPTLRLPSVVPYDDWADWLVDRLAGWLTMYWISEECCRGAVVESSWLPVHLPSPSRKDMEDYSHFPNQQSHHRCSSYRRETYSRLSSPRESGTSQSESRCPFLGVGSPSLANAPRAATRRSWAIAVLFPSY